MKKGLRILSLLLILVIVTGCAGGKKNITFKGKKFNATFEILNMRSHKLSTNPNDVMSNRERAIIIGSNYKIGIEEDISISYNKYNGDFNKLSDNFNDQKDYKKVTYNGIEGFQKYYSSHNRYEVYLYVNDKVSLKLNIYADEDKKIKDIYYSNEIQDILNSVVIEIK